MVFVGHFLQEKNGDTAFQTWES